MFYFVKYCITDKTVTLLFSHNSVSSNLKVEEREAIDALLGQNLLVSTTLALQLLIISVIAESLVDYYLVYNN